MRKFCVLGDTHFGCRNDLSLFYNHFEVFYNDLINRLLAEGITDIFQLGDLFDRRKYINFKTLNESKRVFFDKLEKAGIRLHVLIGNHDIFFRNSIEVNSPSLVLGEYDNITVYQKPSTIEIHGTTIDMIPWICADNEKEITTFIKNSKSDLCFGHFEITGFAMYRGMDSTEGVSQNLFTKYESVLSGHFHTRSKKDNITYVGTPYEMTWHDWNDPKGYHIFDCDTRELEFIVNKRNIFTKIFYDDNEQIPNIKGLNLVDCFVKLIVVNKTDMYKFDNFTQSLYEEGCYEIKIIEDNSDAPDVDISGTIDLEDTMDVLSNYIDSIEFIDDKPKVKTFIKKLYIEATNQSS